MCWVGLQVEQSLKVRSANDYGNKQGLNPEFNMPDPSESSKPKRRKRGRRTRRTKRSVTTAKRRCLSDDDLNRKSALVPRAPLLMYHRGRGYNSSCYSCRVRYFGERPFLKTPIHLLVSFLTPRHPLPTLESPAVEMSLDEDTTQSESDDSETESNSPFSPGHQ